MPRQRGARRQSIVVTSTVHAEYVALAESARENAYLRTLLCDLRCPAPHATTLHGDNEGALTLVTKPAFHQRTKHIEVRWHYIREAQDNGDVSVQAIRSTHQVADILTKSLPAATHEQHRRALGLLRIAEVQAGDQGEQRVSNSGHSGTRRDVTHPSTLGHNPGPSQPKASISGPRLTGPKAGPSQDRVTRRRHGGHSRAGGAGRDGGLEDEDGSAMVSVGGTEGKYGDGSSSSTHQERAW